MVNLWIDWFAFASIFVAWSFALYIYLVAPRTLGAKYLITILIVDGVALMTAGNIYPYFSHIFHSLGLPDLPRGSHQVSDWILVALYLPFLGMTLKTPLVKPFKHPIGKNITLYGGCGFALSIFFMPEDVRNLFNAPFYLIICITLSYSFIAALHSWVIATDPAERQRAKAFTFAFGIRDLLWSFSFGTLFYYVVILEDPKTLVDPDNAFAMWRGAAYLAAVLLYVPLVAYGILRLQLFDVDLRIKRTIKRSTIAAAFVATFFVVSELAANYLSDQLGTIMGVLATGILVFFLDSIQRAAEKVSNAAMPNTNESVEYLSFRKLQVYESSVRASLEDGVISERQRKVLDSMISSMNLDSNIAQQIERDILVEISTK